MEVQLWFERELVAIVTDVFSSDGTWYGRLGPVRDSGATQLQRRIQEFIEFSVAWNRQLEEHPEIAGDPSDYSVYDDLIGSGKWHVVSGETSSIVAQAPVFYGDLEVSWVCDEANGAGGGSEPGAPPSHPWDEPSSGR